MAICRLSLMTPRRRIRSLEAHVADIRQTQTVIQNTLLEIASHLRGGAPFHSRSPSFPVFAHQSPSALSMGSPSVSTPSASASHPPQLMLDTSHAGPTSPSSNGTVTQGSGPMSATLGSNTHRPNRDPTQTHYRSPSLGATGRRPVSQHDIHNTQLSASGNLMYPPPNPPTHRLPAQGTTLPPFSSIESMGPPRTQPSNVSSMRYNPVEGSQAARAVHRTANGQEATIGTKRAAPTSSNVTSADSSDVEDDDGELPASGLVAPWEVLRGLADVAIQRAAKVRRSTVMS